MSKDAVQRCIFPCTDIRESHMGFFSLPLISRDCSWWRNSLILWTWSLWRIRRGWRELRISGFISVKGGCFSREFSRLKKWNNLKYFILFFSIFLFSQIFSLSDTLWVYDTLSHCDSLRMCVQKSISFLHPSIQRECP